MAGAGISSVNGTDAIAWNPAGLDGSENPTSALFSYRAYIADIGISYLAVGTRFEGFGSLGLSLRSFNIGTIPVTTEDQPDGNGQQLNPTFFTLGLTYSKQLSDRVSIGATTNLVSESFGGVSAMGVAFDVGVQYQNDAGLSAPAGFLCAVLFRRKNQLAAESALFVASQCALGSGVARMGGGGRSHPGQPATLRGQH